MSLNLDIQAENAGMSMKERGEKILWIRLREGLRKTMRIPRANYHNNTKRSSNMFSND